MCDESYAHFAGVRMQPPLTDKPAWYGNPMDAHGIPHPAEPIRTARALVDDLTEQLNAARDELTDALVEGARRGLDGDALVLASGLSRTAITRHLSRAGVSLDDSVRYHDLGLTAIVTASAEPLPDGRGPISLASSPAEIAERSLSSWPLDKAQRFEVPVRRLIVRLGRHTATPGRIVADWDLDPTAPMQDDRFNPMDVNEHDRRGVVGQKLSMQGEKLATKVTWSRDIRALLTRNGGTIINQTPARKP